MIEYPATVHSAMEYVFGFTFTCCGIDTAALIAFNGRFQCSCVTRDGDVCNAEGETGGAVPDEPAILTEL